MTRSGAIGCLRVALGNIDGPAAASIPPWRHLLKGHIPQFQKIVEEGCADIGLGTMKVPLKMSQFPPRGRFPDAARACAGAPAPAQDVLARISHIWFAPVSHSTRLFGVRERVNDGFVVLPSA